MSRLRSRFWKRLWPAALLAPALLAGCAPDDGSVQSQKLGLIQGRGKLICGVEGKLPGFSFVAP